MTSYPGGAYGKYRIDNAPEPAKIGAHRLPPAAASVAGVLASNGRARPSVPGFGRRAHSTGIE